MLLTFLQSLRTTGQAVLDPPQGELLPAILAAGELVEEQIIIEALEPWYLEERLHFPGDPIEFHPHAALWGAKWMFQASCFYTFREIVELEVRNALEAMLTTMPDPNLPEAHLSADLLLQYLPELHNRCMRLSTEDVLTVSLQKLASQLPLSGIGIVERTIDKGHALCSNPEICQYMIERAINLKCRKTFEIDSLKQLAVDKLGAYTDPYLSNLNLAQ